MASRRVASRRVASPRLQCTAKLIPISCVHESSRVESNRLESTAGTAAPRRRRRRSRTSHSRGLFPFGRMAARRFGAPTAVHTQIARRDTTHALPRSVTNRLSVVAGGGCDEGATAVVKARPIHTTSPMRRLRAVLALRALARSLAALFLRAFRRRPGEPRHERWDVDYHASSPARHSLPPIICGWSCGVTVSTTYLVNLGSPVSSTAEAKPSKQNCL